MNTRKRQAQDPLLPIGSIKHPRTTRYKHYFEEEPGIAARWMNLCKEVWTLAGLTFAQLTEARTSETSPPGYLLPSTPSSPFPTQISFSTPSPSKSRPQSHTSRPLRPPPRTLHARRQLTREATVPHTTEAAPSHPSTISVTASTASVLSTSTHATTYPEIHRTVSEVTRRARRNSPEKPYRRPHIYADSHKAKVKIEARHDRQEMEKELYNLRRNAGYRSDFNTFKSLLDYRRKLEAFERPIPHSPSLVDISSKYPAPERSRRHSHPDGDNFLERALAKARETLNGPKPPKPWLPTFEQLQISARAKDEKIEQRLRPRSKPLPTSLSTEDDAQVNTILNKRGVVAKHAREQVSDRDLSRLRPGQWLNDEIINFYGSMILSRSEESRENPAITNGAVKGKPLNAHYFSTFFWSKLKGEGYEKGRMAKWTKKIDVFSKDVILIPVNHNNSHWTAAAINFRRKRIESYDSMGMDRQNVFKLLRGYLDAEHRNKKKQPFDFAGWEDHLLEDTPQQENCFDCGVFTCQFLEQLSRGEETFNFTQAHMPYLRRRMVWEIGHTKFMGSS